jgi:hypothetical protein
MVMKWVGLLDQRNKPNEKLRTRLKKMHAKSWDIDDPIEKSTKFSEKKDEDDKLDSMDEVNRVAKTTL